MPVFGDFRPGVEGFVEGDDTDTDALPNPRLTYRWRVGGGMRTGDGDEAWGDWGCEFGPREVGEVLTSFRHAGSCCGW